jgi:single-strand DNA-binding protein
MAGSNINRVTVTGNLTRDPELRAAGSTQVCSMRLAVNERRKNQDGTWGERANYFDVTVWGAQGENCARFLKKGRGVAVDGRLQWREWTDKEQNKRQSVDIIAETVQFLGGRDDAPGGSQDGYSSSGSGFSAPRSVESDIPVDTADFVSAPVGSGSAAEDDIPF